MNLSRLILPQVCVLCGVNVEEAYFCAACKTDLPWIATACEKCGQPLPAGTLCADCQLDPPQFEKAVAPLLYTFPVDSALKALKFKRQLYFAPAFGDLLLPLLEDKFPDVDALLPVPLHRFRHASRGFNQATELSRPLRGKSGLALVRNVVRVRATPPQTGLHAAERRRNMAAAFEVCGALKARHLLVIDDVITTGETCRQLSAALLAAGARKVSVLAIARAGSA